MADSNAEVTQAILEAERALDDAVRAWNQVLYFERVLAEQPAGLERDLAQRGAARAEMISRVLLTLRG